MKKTLSILLAIALAFSTVVSFPVNPVEVDAAASETAINDGYSIETDRDNYLTGDTVYVTAIGEAATDIVGIRAKGTATVLNSFVLDSANNGNTVAFDTASLNAGDYEIFIMSGNSCKLLKSIKISDNFAPVKNVYKQGDPIMLRANGDVSVRPWIGIRPVNGATKSMYFYVLDTSAAMKSEINIGLYNQREGFDGYYDLPEGVYEVFYIPEYNLTYSASATGGTKISYYISVVSNGYSIETDRDNYLTGDTVYVSAKGKTSTDWVGIKNKWGNTVLDSFIITSADGITKALNTASLGAGDYEIFIMPGGKTFAEGDYRTLKNIKISDNFAPVKSVYKQGEPVLLRANGDVTVRPWIGIRPVSGANKSMYFYVLDTAAAMKSEINIGLYNKREGFDGYYDLPVGIYEVYYIPDYNLTYDASASAGSKISHYITVTTSGRQDNLAVNYDLAPKADGLASGTVTVKSEADIATHFRGYWTDKYGVTLKDYDYLPPFAATGTSSVYDMIDDIIIPENAGGLKIVALYQENELGSYGTVTLPADAAFRNPGKPIYQFAMISDTHAHDDINDHYCNQNRQAFKQLKSLLPTDAPIFINGDVTNNGWDSEYTNLQTILTEVYGTSKPQIFTSIGNHDGWGNNTSTENAHQRFAKWASILQTKVTVTDVYYDYWVGDDYHFIITGDESLLGKDSSIDSNIDGLNAIMSDAQLDWLDAKIAESEAKGAKSFILCHQGLYNTVAGTDDFSGIGNVSGDDANDHCAQRVRSIFAKYCDPNESNIYFFNGHTHASMNYTNNYMKGDDNLPNIFNTSSVAYVNHGLYGKAEQNYYSQSQGYIVKVYDDKIMLYGRNFRDNKWIPGATYCMYTDYGLTVDTDITSGSGEVTVKDPSEISVVDKSKPLSILFVGNSSTFYNSMPEVLFKNITVSAGYDVTVTSLTRGGQFLIDSANPDNVLGAQVVKTLAEEKFDYVVLQDNTLSAINQPDKFDAGIRAMVEMVRENGATPILYSTIARANGHSELASNGLTNKSMTDRVAKAYADIGHELGVAVAHVGRAFYQIHNSDTAVNLYDTDNAHPSKAGSYLAALTIFARITGNDPTELIHNIDLDETVNAALKNAAKNVVFNTSSNNKISSGADVNLLITPADGYKVSAVSVNGTSLAIKNGGAEAVYGFACPDIQPNVDVAFALKDSTMAAEKDNLYPDTYAVLGTDEELSTSEYITDSNGGKHYYAKFANGLPVYSANQNYAQTYADMQKNGFSNDEYLPHITYFLYAPKDGVYNTTLNYSLGSANNSRWPISDDPYFALVNVNGKLIKGADRTAGGNYNEVFALSLKKGINEVNIITICPENYAGNHRWMNIKNFIVPSNLIGIKNTSIETQTLRTVDLVTDYKNFILNSDGKIGIVGDGATKTKNAGLTFENISYQSLQSDVPYLTMEVTVPYSGYYDMGINFTFGVANDRAYIVMFVDGAEKQKVQLFASSGKFWSNTKLAPVYLTKGTHAITITNVYNCKLGYPTHDGYATWSDFGAIKISNPNFGNNDYNFGDVDTNGTINSDDLVALKKMLLECGDATLRGETLADINCSGDIDLKDMLRLKKYLVDSSTTVGPQ